jgi:hypothetical protein
LNYGIVSFMCRDCMKANVVETDCEMTIVWSWFRKHYEKGRVTTGHELQRES